MNTLKSKNKSTTPQRDNDKIDRSKIARPLSINSQNFNKSFAFSRPSTTKSQVSETKRDDTLNNLLKQKNQLAQNTCNTQPAEVKKEKSYQVQMFKSKKNAKKPLETKKPTNNENSYSKTYLKKVVDNQVRPQTAKKEPTPKLFESKRKAITPDRNGQLTLIQYPNSASKRLQIGLKSQDKVSADKTLDKREDRKENKTGDKDKKDDKKADFQRIKTRSGNSNLNYSSVPQKNEKQDYGQQNTTDQSALVLDEDYRSYQETQPNQNSDFNQDNQKKEPTMINKQATVRNVKKYSFYLFKVGQQESNQTRCEKQSDNLAYEAIAKNIVIYQYSISIGLRQQSQQNLSGLVSSIKRGQIFPITQPAIPHEIATIKPTNVILERSLSPAKQMRSLELLNKTDNSYIYSLIAPVFKGSIYYQSSLIHYHYQKIYGKQSPKHFSYQLVYKVEDAAYFMEIYHEHFIQNFFCLKYCQNIRPQTQQELQSKIVQFKYNQNHKRTIVFDLDETLIHCSDSNDEPAEFIIPIDFNDGESIQARINVRPFCREMLQVLSDHFEIVVFTASHRCYAEKVIELIDPTGQLIKYRLFRDHCVQAAEGLYIKDLRVIGNRDLEVINSIILFYFIKNMLLVDNASYSFCHQLSHGVPIIPFYDNKNDKELIYLTHYLLSLENIGDWISMNAQQFHMNTYAQCKSQDDCLLKLSQFLIL